MILHVGPVETLFVGAVVTIFVGVVETLFVGVVETFFVGARGFDVRMNEISSTLPTGTKFLVILGSDEQDSESRLIPLYLCMTVMILK